MSHITAGASSLVPPHDDHGGEYDLSPANITLPEGTGRGLSLGLIVVGAVGVLAALGVGFSGGDPALAAYHIGVMSVLAVSLGAMFWVLAFHLTMAGWSTTVRRQFENVMMMAPLAGLGVLALLVYEMSTGGHLFAWMTSAIQKDPSNVVFQKKAGYFNPIFFMIRSVVYVGLWAYLARRLRKYSVEQDDTGDRWLSNRARFTSSWGMLAFALSSTFAAFDWIMALDYRFFSTMWGVYFFAGAAFSSIPVVVIVLTLIRRTGRLRGLVNEEHYHDLGKLMFGFTVFWAYIGFSQYFLIWYANIPEETFWMLARKTGPWRAWTMLLAWGHFILPFWILLWKFVRRTPGLLSMMAAWAILMEIADMVWIIRPLVYAQQLDQVQLGRVWLDLIGIGGVWLVFAGLLIQRVASGPLIPTRDPRLGEALQHRNYV
jgi:hypothetical protein